MAPAQQKSESGLPQRWQHWPDQTGPGGATPSALRASSSFTIFLSPPSSTTAVKHGPCLLTLEKRIQVFETKCMRKLLRVSYLEHKTNDWVRSKINFFWQLSRDGNLHGSGVTHATTASSKTTLQSTLEGGRRRDRRRKSGWTTSKSGHICPCQNYSQGPPAEKTGRGSLLNRPSCHLDDSMGQGTELNRTEPN